MIDDIAGYRYADLLNSRIVSSRSDLNRKQRFLGFPKPVKTGDRSAWWPASEIHAWLQGRIDMRDDPANTSQTGSATNVQLPHSPPAATRKSLPRAGPRRDVSPEAANKRGPDARLKGEVKNASGSTQPMKEFFADG
jgi:predicted DNA-binding transcriptional regulator AlpA